VTGATGLDHVGIAGRDLGALAASFTALGFRLTPLARHSGRAAPDAPLTRYATANRCAMLRHGYLELIGIVDPAGWSFGLDAFLARRQGGCILALAMENPAAELARLRRAGVDLPGVEHLQRPVDDAEPEGAQARFSLLALPQAPEGRLQLIRHETPEALWQERFLDHPNHAVALEAVVIATPAPAESAARLSRLAGRAATPDPEGGFRIALPAGLVRLLPAPGAEPHIAGVVVGTDDGNAAVTGLLRAADIPHEMAAEGVLATEAGVQFAPARLGLRPKP
jgi:hypothetical protein